MKEKIYIETIIKTNKNFIAEKFKKKSKLKYVLILRIWQSTNILK